MSDSEDDDEEEPRREKVKKTLLNLADRQQSSGKLDYHGVKSYLHQFYEYTKDPETSGPDGEFLVKSRRVRVRSIYWRVILASGLMLMGLGLCAVLLSYLLPQKSVIVEEDEELTVIDKDADHFNRNLEYLKLTGLATFCIGGISSSMALMLASCCFRRCNALESAGSSTAEKSGGYYEDIEPPATVAKKLVEEGAADTFADDSDLSVVGVPLSPLEGKIPGNQSVFSVQPVVAGGAASGGAETAYPGPVISTSTTVL